MLRRNTITCATLLAVVFSTPGCSVLFTQGPPDDWQTRQSDFSCSRDPSGHWVELGLGVIGVAGGIGRIVGTPLYDYTTQGVGIVTVGGVLLADSIIGITKINRCQRAIVAYQHRKKDQSERRAATSKSQKQVQDKRATNQSSDQPTNQKPDEATSKNERNQQFGSTLTVEQAAEFCGVKPAVIRRAISQGKINTMPASGGFGQVLPRPEVADYCE